VTGVDSSKVRAWRSLGLVTPSFRGWGLTDGPALMLANDMLTLKAPRPIVKRICAEVARFTTGDTAATVFDVRSMATRSSWLLAPLVPEVVKVIEDVGATDGLVRWHRQFPDDLIEDDPDCDLAWSLEGGFWRWDDVSGTPVSIVWDYSGAARECVRRADELHRRGGIASEDVPLHL
jgi:hypothetical protein